MQQRSVTAAWEEQVRLGLICSSTGRYMCVLLKAKQLQEHGQVQQMAKIMEWGTRAAPQLGTSRQCQSGYQ